MCQVTHLPYSLQFAWSLVKANRAEITWNGEREMYPLIAGDSNHPWITSLVHNITTLGENWITKLNWAKQLIYCKCHHGFIGELK